LDFEHDENEKIFKYKKDATDTNCYVSSIRGIKKMELTIKTDIKDEVKIHIRGESWLMDSTVYGYVTLLLVGPFILAVVCLYWNGWCFCDFSAEWWIC
jgi:hypothetical protein